MAFIHRIKESKPNNLINHCKRYYFHLTTPQYTNQTPSLHRLLSPNHHYLTNSPNFQSIYKCPDDFFNYRVRFFAAPIQFPKKEEEKEVKPNRLRINEEITAQYLRLITDEGHSVVSLHEAMSRAKSLDLDLVEVDRTAKPPVCKIFDFSREKYKKKVRDKERAKEKAAGSVRKGNPKEVRISAKTEMKDLQLKADTIKRLMEKGYRVKCTALGSEEQLSGLISQLCALIEDDAFVENGPNFESRQAILMVRHKKFGASKKGRKKASKDKTATSSETPTVASTDDVEEESSEESDSNDVDEEETPFSPATPVSSADQRLDKKFDVGHDVKATTSSRDERVKFYRGTTASSEYNNAPGSSTGVPSFNNPGVRQETENRYARTAASTEYNNAPCSSSGVPSFNNPNVRQETENRYARTAASTEYNDASGSSSGGSNVRQEPENRYARSAAKNTSTMRNPNRFPDNGSHPPPSPPPPPRSPPRPSVPSPTGPRQRGGDGRQLLNTTNFGIFSNPNNGHPSDATRTPRPGMVPGNSNSPPPPKSDTPQKPESADKKFGIFSR